MGKNKNRSQHNKPHLNKKFKEDPSVSSNGNSNTNKQTLTWDEVKPELIIDGSLLEGGGQILRNTLSLASLYQKSLKIDKIRNGRDQPGLKQQHRTGIELLSVLYESDLIGCSVGSTQLYYKPKKHILSQLEIEADTKTAGSIGLIIQQTLPCIIYSQNPVTMKIGGGTNVDFAPHVDYIADIFQPIFKQHFLKETEGSFEVAIDKRGYYPRGGGCTTVKTQPIKKPFSPLVMLDKGNVIRVEIKSYYAGRVTPLVAERMSNQAYKSIKKDLKKVEIEREEIDVTARSYGDGCFIFIKAITDTGCLFGATANGAIGVPAETVAQNAVDSLLRDLQVGGCTDEYLQDQVIIFMALASGQSQLKTGPLSLHTQTSIHFTSLITGATFKVDEVPKEKRLPGEETFIITCNGVGFNLNHNLENNNNNNNNNNNITTATTTTTTTTNSNI